MQAASTQAESRRSWGHTFQKNKCEQAEHADAQAGAQAELTVARAS